ncbi:hypothetical protein PRIC1_013527 [Phytophthora ramorum]
MEGGDLSAVVGPPPKARRGSGAAIYEKYLNIKKNTLVEVDGPADPTNKPLEISNSTDEQELEAGEVYAAMRVGAPVRMINNGHDMTSPRRGRPGGPGMGGPGGPMSPRMIGGAGGPPRGRSRSRSRGRNGNDLAALQEVGLAAGQVALHTTDLVVDLAVHLAMALVGDQVAHLVVTLTADLAVHRVGILTEDLAVHRAVVLVVDAVALDAMGSTGVQEMALADAPHRRWTDVMTSVADHQ